MGSHREPWSLPATLRRWGRLRRYRREMRRLMKKEPRPVSVARYVQLQAMARARARRAEDGHE